MCPVNTRSFCDGGWALRCSPGFLDCSDQKPGCRETRPTPYPQPFMNNPLSPTPARSHFYPLFSILMATTLHWRMGLSTPSPMPSPPRSQSTGHVLSFTCVNLPAVVSALQITRLVTTGHTALRHQVLQHLLDHWPPRSTSNFFLPWGLCIAGPSPGNNIPLALHMPGSFSTFRAQLECHLRKTSPDCPI